VTGCYIMPWFVGVRVILRGGGLIIKNTAGHLKAGIAVRLERWLIAVLFQPFNGLRFESRRKHFC
jgi:hypothetical protein